MLRLASFPSLFLLALLGACGVPADDASDTETPDTDFSDTDTSDTDTSDTDTSDTSDSDDGLAADIAIAGDWVDNWGGEHTVNNNSWRSTNSSFAITVYDNDVGYAVAKNSADNEWSPSLWSRFDWALSGGDWFYCQSVSDAASEAEALAAPPPDTSSLTTGCGGFSWSSLRAPLSIAARWDDASGTQNIVDAFEGQSGRSRFAITEADDAARWVVAQNNTANDLNPSLWSRFDWVWDASGDLYYCQSADAAASESDALAAGGAADSANLVAGCKGLSWTALRPSLSLTGTWLGGGTEHTITAFKWLAADSRYDITEANDEEGWLVAQNHADNLWNPNLWSRFDWSWGSDGALWYCQTAYAAVSEAAALATAPPDATDPAVSGCSLFPWTSLEAE